MTEEPEKKELTLSPQSDWGPLEKTELVKLPSGRVARLKRPSMFHLIKTGRVPNPLLQKVLKKTEERGELEADAALFEFMEEFAAACFVEPIVWVKQPIKGGIPITNLDDAEIAFVCEWANLGVMALSLFR